MKDTFLSRHRYFLFFVAFIGAILMLFLVQIERTPPTVKVAGRLPDGWGQLDAALALPWPTQGSAAVAIGGAGPMGATKKDDSRPIASLVKIMTAYVILKDHPLKLGEQGPVITVQDSDLALYQQQLKNGESVVAVKPGTDLTELALLQGLLIPSGNNYAYMLANWNSGSIEAFADRMNEEAASLGMKDSRYGEPSGAADNSFSTAADQVKLAQAAMSNQIFAQIVGLKQAQLPTAGVVFNVNSKLGQDNIVGIKTGWTDNAGACFVFAADRQIGGETVRVYGAVLGQNILDEAFSESRALLSYLDGTLQVASVDPESVPATVQSAWGDTGAAVPAKAASVVIWPGLDVQASFKSNGQHRSVKKGDEVGVLHLSAGQQSKDIVLVAQDNMGGAGLSWRLLRLR